MSVHSPNFGLFPLRIGLTTRRAVSVPFTGQRHVVPRQPVFYNEFMPRKPRTNRFLLTDIELELMRAVWNKGKASASEVQLEMVRDGRETAYTTVKTMLDRLVKAGVCSAKETRGRYYYSPRVSREKLASEARIVRTIKSPAQRSTLGDARIRAAVRSVAGQ